MAVHPARAPAGGRAAIACALVAFVVTFAVGAAVSLALWDGTLYDQLVVAQQEVGWHTLHEDGGLAAQALWNLVPLLVPAAAGVAFGRYSSDPTLLRVIVALSVGALVLVGTIAKTGTYINTISLAEPPLVALGVSGGVWLIRNAPSSPARAGWSVAIATSALLGAVQVVAFAARPSDPGPFLRPFSAPAHAWTNAGEVARRVHRARACPPRQAYSGVPFIAFLARRRMPGDQPDQFLIAQSPVVSSARQEAEAEAVVCP